MNSTSISLLNGGFFDYATPERSQYTIKDVSRGLAHTNRFSGHTDRGYPVGQHSILVSKMLPPELQLEGLLHDGTEFAMCDIPKPLKNLIPEYSELERRALLDMFKRFGVKPTFDKRIKEADNIVFVTERRDLQPGVPLDEKYEGIQPLPTRIIAWDARTCYINFLKRFEELTK